MIGTQFYVMEYVQGRIFRDAGLMEAPPTERRLLYTSLVKTLAWLHNIDWRGIGLEGYGGRRNNDKTYCERQVRTHTQPYSLILMLIHNKSHTHSHTYMSMPSFSYLFLFSWYRFQSGVIIIRWLVLMVQPSVR